MQRALCSDQCGHKKGTPAISKEGASDDDSEDDTSLTAIPSIKPEKPADAKDDVSGDDSDDDSDNSDDFYDDELGDMPLWSKVITDTGLRDFSSSIQ